MGEILLRFEGLRDKMHDDRYEDIILMVIIPECDFVRTECYPERDFGPDNIRTAICNANNDRIQVVNSIKRCRVSIAHPGCDVWYLTSPLQMVRTLPT